MNMLNSTVYIIILNWNGFYDTLECLDSLMLINKEQVQIKIVVIDNASKNNEGKKIIEQYSNVKVIFNNENVGFAKGNNIGIAYALQNSDCTHIMLLNNDTAVDKDFLLPLLEYLYKNDNIVVSPKILYYTKRNTIQTMGGKLFLGGAYIINKNRLSQNFVKITYPDTLCFACCLARAETFRRVGFLDERFFAYLEDVDWCLRAKKMHYNLAVIPQSIIYHKHSRSTRGTFLKVYFGARNNIYLAKKHYSGILKIVFIINSIMLGFINGLIKYKSLLFLKSYSRGVKDGIYANFSE